MNKKLLSLAAMFAVTTLVAAGCGGDDSSSDEPAPTKTAYITDADAICQADQAKLEAIADELPNDINAPESQAAISDEILPIYQDQLTALRELTPPEGDEEATAGIYDALDEALQKLDADPKALAEPETYQEANELAVEYGLEVCGN